MSEEWETEIDDPLITEITCEHKMRNAFQSVWTRIEILERKVRQLELKQRERLV